MQNGLDVALLLDLHGQGQGAGARAGPRVVGHVDGRGAQLPVAPRLGHRLPQVESPGRGDLDDNRELLVGQGLRQP